jgi:transposase
MLDCDRKLEVLIAALSNREAKPVGKLSKPRVKTKQVDTPTFDVRTALYGVLGVDLTEIHGLGPSLALKLVGECGKDLRAWPSAKHFTSWLCLAPGNKISGGKVLSSRTRRSSSRAAALLRLAATTVGRSDTALGAFYRRLSTLRHGMSYKDPGADQYEQQYRSRVLANLRRRAKSLGFVLQAIPGDANQAVS